MQASRTKSSGAALAITAAVTVGLLFIGNEVWPHVLYWPTVVLALPAMPVSFAVGLVWPDHPFDGLFFYVIPPLAWGLVACIVVAFWQRPGLQ